MRIDPRDPEKDLQTPRLIILHGPDSLEIGRYAVDYFSKVNHSIQFLNCESSMEFLKTAAFKWLKRESISDLQTTGAQAFEQEHLVKCAMEALNKYIENKPGARWREVHNKIYTIKKLDYKSRAEIKNWFEENIEKQRVAKRSLQSLLHKVQKYMEKNPNSTFSAIKHQFNLSKQTQETQKYIEDFFNQHRDESDFEDE